MFNKNTKKMYFLNFSVHPSATYIVVIYGLGTKYRHILDERTYQDMWVRLQLDRLCSGFEIIVDTNQPITFLCPWH